MASASIGIDLGNYNTVVAVARKRAIDVVLNDVSNRATPSIVGFGVKSRFIGEGGKTQQTSNIKNTADNIKRIIGLKYDHPDVKLEKDMTKIPMVEVKGEVGVQVRFKGEQHTFSSIQLAAMYLNKIKGITANETKLNISDVVLAVPSWYNLAQRHAIADAARVAGLKPVRIVNDLTAAAVSYGVFKTDLEEDKTLNIAFVDIGQSAYEVSIIALKKGELRVLGNAFDKFLGGRYFDVAIAKHFIKELEGKYKIKDVEANPKSFSRILTSAEKLKKILSANTQAPFNVESVINDIDFSSTMTRETLEELCAPLLARIDKPIEDALAQAGLTPEDIDLVELIGGGSRIPAVKDKISSAFGNKQLSYHLNQDEAIAKGATFICAMSSLTMRVRPYKFTDRNPYAISYEVTNQTVEDDSEFKIFDEGRQFPSASEVSLKRNGDFNITAKYTSARPEGADSQIASWSVKGVQVPEGKPDVFVKLCLRLDESGFPTVVSAYTIEETQVQEEIPYEGEDEIPEDYEPKYKTVTKFVKAATLTVTQTSSLSLPIEQLNELTEIEGQLVASDNLVFKTENMRNQIEEYIYEFRNKLDEEYAPFVKDNEKERFLEQLLKAEDWLYDHEDASLGVYNAKYEELASKGNLIKGRYQQAENEKLEAANPVKEYEAFQKHFANTGKTNQPSAEETKEDSEMDID